MKILVTAGNTQTPIDQVRCLTNIFSGRTGARIAIEAARRGHHVTLMTSHPEVLVDEPSAALNILPYRTFDDLSRIMEGAIPGGGFDAIVHAAAVSDYALGGVFTRLPDGSFEDASAGKVKSHHPELWLRLTPAPKLIDRIRRPWGFTGMLVKFKLEVGIDRASLLEIAEHSRRQSAADYLVANTLESMHDWAWIGPTEAGYEQTPRAELAARLMTLIEGRTPAVFPADG